MLEKPAAVYQQAALAADELETLVRSAVFAREVLRAYDSTCAVSGLQLLSIAGTALPSRTAPRQKRSARP
jgi:putative restriction endonuclease